MESAVIIENASLVALEELRKGNERFINNIRINRNYLQEVEATKEGQQPYAVVISCMDSRTSPELIFDQGLGDIFSIRIAGNVVTPEVVGSAEYACKVVGSKLILVLGHLGCGAIKGAVENVKLGLLPTVTERIQFSIKKDASLEEVTVSNVRSGIRKLKEDSPILNQLVESGELIIAGGIYDIRSGEVRFISEDYEV